MNASLLTGIAAALRGGLQGYQTAQANQRQAALDDLARKRQEDDAALRQAAIQANALARKNAEDAKAKALEAAGVARDRREFQAPILADVNKHGVSPATEEALSLTDRYLGANAQSPTPFETLPVDPSVQYREAIPEGVAPDKMVELDGVTAFPESFKESRGDVLKLRAQALTKKDGTAPSLPTLPNGRTPEAEKAYQVARARQDGKADGKKVTPPSKPVDTKFIDSINAAEGQITQIGDIVNSALKLGADFPTYVGLKFNDLLAYVGKQDPTKTAYVAKIKTNVSNSVRALSGAAATDAERAYIAQQQPNEMDTLDSLLLKAHNVSRFAKWHRANLIENLRRAGRDVSRYPTEKADNPMDDARSDAEILAEIKAAGGLKGPAAALAGPQEVERKTLPNGEVWAKYADGTFKKVGP